MKTVILIPAYKPDEKFVEFSKILISRGHTVVAVDDGGGPDFAGIFDQVRELGVTVVTHEVNMGKGMALKTGIRYIYENIPGVDFVVTADCDGQHRADDIEKVIKAGEENPDVLILGGRFRDKNVKVPFKSRLGNGFTRVIFWIATGTKIYDTQTGLRGLPRKIFPELITLKGERYEYEMNMLLNLHIWRQEYKEIPIETVYIDNNKSTHYNVLRDSIRIFGEILKFTITSLSSFVMDVLALLLFNYWVFSDGSINIASIFNMPQGNWVTEVLERFSLAYLCARLVSGTLNYWLNRKLVFKSRSKSSVAKYFVLAIVIMFVGAFATGGLQSLGWHVFFAKVATDTPLYFINYFAQREWVFKKHKKKGKKLPEPKENEKE